MGVSGLPARRPARVLARDDVRPGPELDAAKASVVGNWRAIYAGKMEPSESSLARRAKLCAWCVGGPSGARPLRAAPRTWGRWKSREWISAQEPGSRSTGAPRKAHARSGTRASRASTGLPPRARRLSRARNLADSPAPGGSHRPIKALVARMFPAIWRAYQSAGVLAPYVEGCDPRRRGYQGLPYSRGVRIALVRPRAAKGFLAPATPGATSRIFTH